MPNLSDRLRAMLNPRPPRGMTVDRVTGWTWHYRPGPVAWPADDRLTPGRAARILWSPTAWTLTDDQLDRIGRSLGLTATDRTGDRDRVTATATDRATGHTGDRDRVTATGESSATDRATVSPTAPATATGQRDRVTATDDRATGHRWSDQGVA